MRKAIITSDLFKSDEDWLYFLEEIGVKDQNQRDYADEIEIHVEDWVITKNWDDDNPDNDRD